MASRESDSPDISILEIPVEEIRMEVQEIAFLSGLEQKSIPEPYLGIIETELRIMRHYPPMRGGYRVSGRIRILPEEGFFLFESVRFNTGPRVAQYLEKSQKLALYLCTAGDSPSQRASDLLASGKIIEGYYADLIGSLLVEKAMDRMQQKLKKDMQYQSHAITNRYSPGYLTWGLEEQHKLFDFFPPAFCSISLTDSGLMTPVKSLSGVIGIGREARFHPYLCLECNSTFCLYRDRKTPPYVHPSCGRQT